MTLYITVIMITWYDVYVTYITVTLSHNTKKDIKDSKIIICKFC